MDSFDGDLTPLNNAPLHFIYMETFKGNLIPLANLPIQLILWEILMEIWHH